MRIRYVNFGQAMIKRPGMVDRWSAMHHNDEGALAAEEIYEELEKRVDSKGLRTRSALVVTIVQGIL